ncbi:unnamed protein product [Debaryomyces fabryi]|nr:unnamed protein product [Debaryomyces fabryi]
MSQQDKIIFHWYVLEKSRSHRILWLLEELNLEYDLKVYRRTKDYRAPPELNKVHPLGKSPVIEIIKPGRSSPIILAETGFMIDYLIRHYDTEQILVPDNEDDKELVNYYLQFAEGSLQPFLVSLLVNNMAKKMAPFGAGFLVNKVVLQINALYYGPELMKSLDFLENNLKKNKGKFFVGNKLTGADIILSFPIYDNVFGDLERTKAMTGGKIDVVAKYPTLKAWSDTISKEPKLLKANEIIDAKAGVSKL